MEMQDKLKLGAAVGILIAGVAGFYALPAEQQLLRVLLFIVALILAAVVVWLSSPGKDFVVYAQESVVEAKKVVWPNRKEATQMTLMVFLFVLVLSLFMWVVDASLSWLFYDVLLKRG